MVRENLGASYALSWQLHKQSAQPVFPSRNYILLLYALVRNSPCMRACCMVKSRAMTEELPIVGKVICLTLAGCLALGSYEVIFRLRLRADCGFLVDLDL